jgi:hypothetical protein
MTYFSGPTPAYNNPPINPQYYQPSRFVITAITLGQTTVITTAVNHNYVIGQIVRLLIPDFYGSIQLNEEEGYVITIPAANQVTVTIYSEQANAFNPTPPFGPTLPQIIAVGDYNSGIISTTGATMPSTNIPGSFINISPN